MEQKLFILVKTEKSNRSENNVWVVSTRSYPQETDRAPHRSGRFRQPDS